MYTVVVFSSTSPRDPHGDSTTQQRDPHEDSPTLSRDPHGDSTTQQRDHHGVSFTLPIDPQKNKVDRSIHVVRRTLVHTCTTQQLHCYIILVADVHYYVYDVKKQC